MNKSNQKSILGAVMTLYAFLLIFLILSISYKTDGFKIKIGGGGWFFEYQTLISAVVAFIAAIATVYVLHRQYQDQILRRRWSSRAKMSAALSELIDYLKLCFCHVWHENQEIPEIPSDPIKVFTDAIEHCDMHSSEYLFQMVSKFQIINSRLKSPIRNQIHQNHRNLFYDIILLNSIVLNVFEYARNQESSIKKHIENLETMTASLKQLVDHRQEYLNHKKYIEIFADLKNRYDGN